MRRWLVRNRWRVGCFGVRRFAFCISTGRAGTTSLSRLFECVPRSVTVHEPFPQMNGKLMHAFNRGDRGPAHNTFWKWKLPQIYKEAAGSRYYFETTNVFIKSFFPFVVEAIGSRLRVIYLERDCHEVAASYYRRGSIPRPDHPWQLDPLAPRNCIAYRNIVRGDKQLEHDYLKCVWTWYEVKARARRFHVDYPEIPIVQLRTSDMNDLQRAREFLVNIVGEVDLERLESSTNRRENVSAESPTPPQELPVELSRLFQERCQSELDKFPELP